MQQVNSLLTVYDSYLMTCGNYQVLRNFIFDYVTEHIECTCQTRCKILILNFFYKYLLLLNKCSSD
jgi:hypothetical protein